MKRLYPMPFGATLLDTAEVRFRLWAPGAEHIDLCLELARGEELCAMQHLADGWFELVTDRATPGTRYRYRIDRGTKVPDPAARFQPGDVHGASEVIDPADFAWSDAAWRGRPWHEAIIYELHVGSFTPQGTFAAIKDRLDHLVELGVTAIELMPIADFPGGRNWGYDGVLPFAPESTYGRPEALKDLVQCAHAKGLMVFLDVVYNHFGPDGNYLHLYAPQFFNARHHTPWGAGLNFDGLQSEVVRGFFIHNARYWLEEYHLDGLRFDAIDAIADDSSEHILTQLARVVADGPGKTRHIHLMLENDDNETRFFSADNGYTAQWNDDLHHALHVLLTDESAGYYADYADAGRQLARALAHGFAYQGEPSGFRQGRPRGQPSDHLPPTRFIGFLQNHDQVGNRAFGERIGALVQPQAQRVATVVLLLAPHVPLLFMGQEWNAAQPFPFFCDFGPDLARAVRDGRKSEFAKFPAFSDPASRERIPDPNAAATFNSARLDWNAAHEPAGRRWIEAHRELLRLRRDQIVPRLNRAPGASGNYKLLSERAFAVRWRLGDGTGLTLIANFGATAALVGKRPQGRLLYGVPDGVADALAKNNAPPWSAAWYLEDAAGLALSDAA
jgi:maltooligosyltrehalose trehalohydrolase